MSRASQKPLLKSTAMSSDDGKQPMSIGMTLKPPTAQQAGPLVPLRMRLPRGNSLQFLAMRSEQSLPASSIRQHARRTRSAR